MSNPEITEVEIPPGGYLGERVEEDKAAAEALKAEQTIGEPVDDTETGYLDRRVKEDKEAREAAEEAAQEQQGATREELRGEHGKPSDEDTAETQAAARASYEELTVEQLEAIAEDNERPYSVGSKSELIDRLLRYDEVLAMKKADIVTELEGRGLDTEGTKEVLVHRLLDSD